MSTDTSTDYCRWVEVDDLTRLVEQYMTARATLVEHPDFEAGCAPDRLYQDRDDAAVAVAEATAGLLLAGALAEAERERVHE